MVDSVEENRPGEFQSVAYRCRCGHEWAPRSLRNPERPRTCPKCKSANWDRPYKFRRKSKGSGEKGTEDRAERLEADEANTPHPMANLSDAELMALLTMRKYHPDWTDDETLQEMVDSGITAEEAQEAIRWVQEDSRESTEDER